jgi:Arc/MetJ-type ribon-helix-helix transcriptional regulator
MCPIREEMRVIRKQGIVGTAEWYRIVLQLRYHSGVADYSTRLRLDQPTRQRLDEVVAAGHYRSNNAAVVDAINRLWEQLRQDDLDAAYAAAVADNPSYPYESEAERAVAQARRNARQQAAAE